MTDRKGFILWFTGLSGSGKSTLAQYLTPILIERGCNVEVLDGSGRTSDADVCTQHVQTPETSGVGRGQQLLEQVIDADGIGDVYPGEATAVGFATSGVG